MIQAAMSDGACWLLAAFLLVYCISELGRRD